MDPVAGKDGGAPSCATHSVRVALDRYGYNMASAAKQGLEATLFGINFDSRINESNTKIERVFSHIFDLRFHPSTP